MDAIATGTTPPAEPRYRIVGGLGARERVVATGLTREEATARAAELQAGALVRGMWFSFEEEARAAGWDEWVARAGRIHAK